MDGSSEARVLLRWVGGLCGLVGLGWVGGLLSRGGNSDGADTFGEACSCDLDEEGEALAGESVALEKIEGVLIDHGGGKN